VTRAVTTNRVSEVEELGQLLHCICRPSGPPRIRMLRKAQQTLFQPTSTMNSSDVWISVVLSMTKSGTRIHAAWM